MAEALKESVRSELALKMMESKRLVFELVQPRSAARLSTPSASPRAADDAGHLDAPQVAV